MPTLAEAGLPGEGADTMVGLLAPAQTPRAIIDRLNGAASAIMAMADVRDRAIAMGYEPAVTTPEEFAAYIKAETARWDAVVRGANLRKE